MYKILAILVFIISVISAYFLLGKNIGVISSVGGRTLQEAYYYGLGFIYKGFSLFVLASGVFFSSVLYHFQKK